MSTVEMLSDNEDEAKRVVDPGLKITSADVLARYFDTVNRLITAINGAYHLIPQLVVSNVQTDVLQGLPTLVRGYHVRSQVIDGDLFVLELSTGKEHGTGVSNLIEQIGVWRSQHSADDYIASTPTIRTETTMQPRISCSPWAPATRHYLSRAKLVSVFDVFRFIIVLSFDQFYFSSSNCRAGGV